jgi:long-chain acyl-CoA synthetase
VERSGRIQRFFFHTALKIKNHVSADGSIAKLLDRFIFSNLQAIFGGKIKFMLSGGAPLSPETRSFVTRCFNIPIIEGYGLTETTGPACISSPDEKELCVGAPIGSVEIKLVDVPEMNYASTDRPNPRGEILIRGPSVISEYLDDEENTRNNFTGGWFRTGDIGMWLPNGSLAIIDRKKNLIKGGHGEYIALEKLESIYATSKFALNVCIVMDSSHYFPIAFISGNGPALQQLADRINVKSCYFILKR